VSEPPIAVVIPVRDGEAYLGEAIDSVLAQTVAATEVVIVDNGSRDASREIAEGYGDPVRCIRQRVPTHGPGRNEGVEASSSELLAFLDADDVWPASTLELLVAALLEEPAPDLVYGSVEEFASPGFEAELRPAASAPLLSAMLIRRELIARIGPLREELSAVELEWVARARHVGVTERVIPEVVLRRRIHAANYTRDPAVRREYIAAAREMIAARRARA
jgi:glycosyltransferase involved in cell wall biosynthesis